jgi:glycine/D-amino acid oxidase-like deaminating enzyme
MSTVKITDLPPIAHHMHKIILAAQLENHHLRVTGGQAMDPALAREHAIMLTIDPKTPSQKAQVEEAYRVVIRLFQALDGLGIKYEANRRITSDQLVFMGLPRGGRLNG